MSILDRQKISRKPIADGEFLLEEDEWAQEYPGLFEMLTRVRYQGKDREPGRLIIFAGPGKATLVLCDKQTSQVAFYTGDGIAEALSGLERALGAGSVDWRKDRRSR